MQSCCTSVRILSKNLSPRSLFHSTITTTVRRPSTRAYSTTSSSSSCPTRAEVVVCGAGIVGVSTAYHLSLNPQIKSVLVIDERPPCSFTSSMSTEAYRNFWCDDAMTKFMNRSIDIIFKMARESNNEFSLSQHGYSFLSSRAESKEEYEQMAIEAERFGTGPITRYNENNIEQYINNRFPDPIKEDVSGINLINGSKAIQRAFPYLCPSVTSLMHVRRCGWMDAQQFAMHMIARARQNNSNIKFIRGKVKSVSSSTSAVQSVTLTLNDGTTTSVGCDAFVNAAGPFARTVHSMITPHDRDLLVRNEVHGKVVLKDTLGVVPVDTAQLIICDDPVTLKWTDEERAELMNMGWLARQLTEVLPSGVHMRLSSGFLLMLWDFVHAKVVVPDPPPENIVFEELFPEVVVRGLSTKIPGMKAYLEDMPRTTVDGGYYLKAQDNKPMIGDGTIPNYFICTGLSGYGIMGAPAAGELISQYISNWRKGTDKSPLPEYAREIAPFRHYDPNFKAPKTKIKEL